MEDPLLTNNEDIAIDSNSSTNDEHNVNITINDGTTSTAYKAEGVKWRNPCTKERVWGLTDFTLALVQIVAAILVLTRAKDEHPETAFFVWIIGYTCGCFVTLPVRLTTIIIDSSLKDWEEILEFFFLGWAALLLWIYINSPSSIHNSTQHFWLCVAFFAFSIIRYVNARRKFAAICLASVVVLGISSLVTGISPNKLVFVVVIIVIAVTLKNVTENLD